MPKGSCKKDDLDKYMEKEFPDAIVAMEHMSELGAHGIDYHDIKDYKEYERLHYLFGEGKSKGLWEGK